MDFNDTLSEAQIRSLLIRERFYRDAQEWQKMRSCYHPDDATTIIDISWYKGGADGFVNESEKLAARGALALHTIQPVDIQINGSKAFAQSVGTISSRFSKDEIEYDLVSTCRFLSKLQLLDNGPGVSSAWKMLSIEMIYLQDSILPVVPSSIARAPDFAESTQKKRKSYRLLSWVMERKGLTINQKLPGPDDAESVKKVLSQNLHWLSSKRASHSSSKRPRYSEIKAN